MNNNLINNFIEGNRVTVRMSAIPQTGFTLIELMITLAVLGTLIALAAPSFVTFINTNRVTGATNDLIASFHLARTEAIKRNRAVLIQSKNGNTNWAGGYRIGIDLNADGDLLDTVGGVVELLRDVNAPHATVTMVSETDNPYTAVSEISFISSGGVTTATQFSIDSTESDVCDRQVRLDLSGSSTLTVSARPCT